MEQTGIVVYLAGPIDGISAEQASLWRKAVAGEWPDVAFFDPSSAFHNDSLRTIEQIREIDRAAITLSHGVLANLSGSGRGVGTVREIEYACLRGKPVCVVGSFSGTLAFFDVMLAVSLQEGMELLMGEIAKILNTPRSFIAPIMGQFGEEPPTPPDDE